MKHKSYKQIITLVAICFLATVYAQKFDKKFSENFTTNKDVEVQINASNTDIDVTTWNKNEVQVNAYIEIEGVDKELAEKYFKNWEFEALGNKKRVEILSKGNKSSSFKNNFVIFDNMDFDFNIPDIDMSNIEAIVLPNMDFDFDFDFDFDLEELDENMEKNGKYEFMWKDDDHDIEINSKEEWEAFKKTKEYKELKTKMRFDKEKMRKEFAKSKEKMKKAFKKARVEIKEVDTEEIRKGLAKAKEVLKSMNFNFHSDSDDLKIDGKKVKIKKRIEIKVPKGATFDLNTRHCKVKLPNTVAYGNVNYGTFDAQNLNGGKLTINYSPVTIKDLNACTLFLNNVTDAKIASVTNTKLSNNSSGVKIIRINENVNLTDKFGELTIKSFKSDFGEFILNLSQSNAELFLGDVACKYKYNVNRVKLENNRVGVSKKVLASNNLIKINGDYSSIVIK
ncbi:hypothetical protein [Polaribacter porphyrae]|uniref:Adhesin domain-containing protein n=1 Tax=Polaribacter porphyrae TaxID=1137780 RepID=A0A2S7WM29_9FLAO|nr:hypothetical protein [Polaribacter porphyrae]PQJ78667.1 hypothetical protein BTO18_05470 [Polaribacter porphyrae]